LRFRGLLGFKNANERVLTLDSCLHPGWQDLPAETPDVTTPHILPFATAYEGPQEGRAIRLFPAYFGPDLTATTEKSA